jgi:hypothetical protein
MIHAAHIKAVLRLARAYHERSGPSGRHNQLEETARQLIRDSGLESEIMWNQDTSETENHSSVLRDENVNSRHNAAEDPIKEWTKFGKKILPQLENKHDAKAALERTASKRTPSESSLALGLLALDYGKALLEIREVERLPASDPYKNVSNPDH